MPWTPPVDRASNDVITATIWNQSLGATGNITFGAEYFKYKTAAQSLVATTAYADVTATSGTLGFAILANEAWRVEWLLELSTEVAGGLKLQVTGPATPTAVQFGRGYVEASVEPGSFISSLWHERFISATAFSADILAVPGEDGGVGAGTAEQRVGGVRVTGLVVNGANAGTVTLQAAQNTASGTTTISAGRMFARRLVAL